MRRVPQLGQNPLRSPKAPTVGTTEGDQVFGVAGFASHPQKAMFQPPAFEVILEFALDIPGQGYASLRQMGAEFRVILFNNPIEKRLLGPVAFVVESRWCRVSTLCRSILEHDLRPCETVFSSSLSTVRIKVQSQPSVSVESIECQLSCSDQPSQNFSVCFLNPPSLPIIALTT
jgi:hypothetical protein